MTSQDGMAAAKPGNRLLWLVGLLCLAQVVAFSLVRTGTSYDGTEQLLYTQRFEWGYGRSQPPLYTWLLIAVQQVFGVTQVSENLLKFGLLFALCFLLWRVALSLGLKQSAAATVSVSPFLVFEIAWEVQRNYSHSVLLLALVAAFALAYLATLEHRSWRDYCVLGLLLGAMLLTKYNAAFFVAALVVADIVIMGRRGVFWTGKAFLVVGIAALLVAPHAVWAYQHPQHVLALAGKFAITGPVHRMAAIVRGLGSYVLASISILALPALLSCLHRGWQAVAANSYGARGVFALWLVLVVAFGLVLVLVTGTTHVNVRWMLPIVVPALPVLCGYVSDTNERANRQFRTVALIIVVLATGGQTIENWLDARKNYAYDELLAEVVQQTGATELLINDYAVLANLRLYAPEIAMLHPIMPDAASIPLKRPVMVWTGGEGSVGDMVAFAQSLGACPVQAAAHAYTMRSRYGPHKLPIRYQALKLDCRQEQSSESEAPGGPNLR